MTVLDKIIKRKQQMLDEGQFPVSEPEPDGESGQRFTRALAAEGLSVIAEIKRSSPSAGKITSKSVEELAEIYDTAAAACISVLTEDIYFGGSPSDITKVKKITSKPVLMKDFIIFKEQIYLARGCGADAVLLIASILSPEDIKILNRTARQCGLAALNEVHSEGDIEKLQGIEEKIEITGINSRNLKSLKVDESVHGKLITLLDKKTIKVAESGIESAVRARQLEDMGYDAVLVGKSVISAPDPAGKIRELEGK